MFLPGGDGLVDDDSVAVALVSSWITTASAPSGTTPPVKMRTASPALQRAVERPSGGDLADHLQARRYVATSAARTA